MTKSENLYTLLYYKYSAQTNRSVLSSAYTKTAVTQNFPMNCYKFSRILLSLQKLTKYLRL